MLGMTQVCRFIEPGSTPLKAPRFDPPDVAKKGDLGAPFPSFIATRASASRKHFTVWRFADSAPAARSSSSARVLYTRRKPALYPAHVIWEQTHAPIVDEDAQVEAYPPAHVQSASSKHESFALWQ